MSKKLYKYIGAANAEKVFSDDKLVSFKCAYPKDFNDPYELFLTVDYRESPEILAFYKEVVGNIPQVPTTCFSRSPEIIPMWAHYAKDHQGFVLEVEEEVLGNHFPECGFGDVDYKDEVDDGLADAVYRAYEIGKPRYINLLRQSVFSAAYYTKSACWSYEQERRMLVKKDQCRVVDDNLLIDFPRSFVHSVIVGARAEQDLKDKLMAHATNSGFAYYEMRIGRTTTSPFFVDGNGNTYEFRGGEIVKSASVCKSCKEPISTDKESCSWCGINDDHRVNAAERNIFRVLANAGMLDEYLKGMDSISRGSKGGK